MNTVMDLEQLLIMYSRVVDAPEGSEEFSTAVRELRDAINDDAASNHTLPLAIPHSRIEAHQS
jgi:hypothetical protein